MNLVSGLIIAEVAIKQHDSSGEDPPSSFKEFADVNLDLPMAGTVISCISLFVNTCIMSFDLTRAGQILSDLVGGMDPFAMSVGVAALVASLGMLHRMPRISLLLRPWQSLLYSYHSRAYCFQVLPMYTTLSPSLQRREHPADILTGISQAAPIILMTCVYQNIVPSVTKILDYDRTKVVTAMVLGSALPLCMFLAWCFASIGGGIDPSVGAAGPLLTAFSLAAVSGSSIGTVMSVSGELDSFFATSNNRRTKQDEESHRFSVPSVLLSVAAPLTAAYIFAGGEDVTFRTYPYLVHMELLSCMEQIPVAMAWTQRRNKLQVATWCLAELPH